MKRSRLIMLICSLIVVVSLTIATISVVVIGKAIAEDSEMSLERRSLTISSASASMVFDGKKLSDSTWELLEGVLKDGHKLDVTVTGSQGSVGVSENFFNVTVKDENGNDVTDQYDIQYKPGALNVRARSLTVTAKSHSKIYDGTPLVADGYIIESAKSLFEGDYLEVKVEGSITEVGNVDSVITEVKVYNDQGKEVTQNYNIKTNTGKLVVYEPGTLVISSASAYKDYDTLPLTDSNYEVKEGEIILGHVLKVDVYGSQTDVGTGHNEFDVSIVDEYGTDVSYNYKVEKEYGNLVVGQQGVTISSADDDKVYDGTPLTNPGYTVTFDDPSLEGKITYDVKVTGSVVEGSGENTISEYFFYDSEGRDITDFFDVKRDPGELIVFPEDMVKETLKFTAKSAQKFYDGIEMTRNEYDLEGELLPGHYADVKIDGAITDVGVAINSIAVVIRDKNNADVSAFYDIDAIPGVLKVDPVIFTITSADDEKIYDGDPLTNSDFTISPAEILDSFIVEAEITGSQTNPGESPNTIKSYTVKNLNGEALDQKNFEVRTVPGTLKVVQDESNILPVLVYKTYSAKKVYDGTPLENKEWKRLSGELLDGHTEYVEMNVSLTNVGTVKNSITVVIKDGEGNDVSDKYIIVDDGEDIGSLEVTIREFTIKANSDSKTYDSLPLTNSGYTLLGKDGKDALGKNHTIDVVITGSQTSAKTGANQSANTVESYVIYDENGEPVPDGNYYVIKEDGTLTVNKCELTVTAGSDSKDYDGDPLTCDDYTVSYNKGSLVSGHTLEVTVTGSQTEVGSSYNVATYVIYETESGDPTVAENYQVNLIEGTLKVMGAVQEPDEPEPDPRPNGITIGGTSTSNKTVFKIKTKSADIVYLKMSSYGDYQYYQTADGWSSGWTTANPYLGQNLSNGESPFFVTAYALDNSGLSPKTCYYVKATTGISVLPYYVNGDIAKSSTDTTINVNSSALEKEFTYYSWNESLNLRIPSANREAEALYAAEVSKNYLNIDKDTKEFMLELIANNDFGNPNDDILDTIEKVSRYISNAAEYNMNYNQKLNTEKNVVIAFLTDYQEGICQHYASAATLLFRALGVPARYTTGFAVPTKAETEVDVKAKMAHAWVEVYINGIGWVVVEVTGTGSPAMGEENFTLTVTPNTTSGLYVEGKELFANDSVSVQGFDALREKGYYYECVVGGSSNGLGYADSYVESFTIYSPSHKVVYDYKSGKGTDMFTVTYKTGQIHCYLADLGFSSQNASTTVTYNGLPVPIDVGDIVMTKGDISSYDGYSYVITLNKEYVNAGNHAVDFTVTFYKNGKAVDENGTAYNDYFKVSKTSGRIVINKKEIMLTAESAEKVWCGDGIALTSNKLVLDYLDDLAEGDWIYIEGVHDAKYKSDIKINGSQLDIGECSNVIESVIIRNSQNKDVTSNYLITMKDGLLSVTKE